MRHSTFLLLTLLLFLSLGADTVYFGCGSPGVSVGGVFSCGTADPEEDPCDYIVTLQVTVLLAADNSPIEGATVYIVTGPPDAVNRKATDASGQALWTDTSFFTGFSADCGELNVGTVEPYDTDTSFTYDILVSANGLASALTPFTVTRESRSITVDIKMTPL
jgi:hypothetical protein